MTEPSSASAPSPQEPGGGGMLSWTVLLPSMKLTWSDALRSLYALDADRTPSIEEAVAFYAPEYRALVIDAFSRAMTQGTAFDLEVEVLVGRGRRRRVRARGEAVKNGVGEIARIEGRLEPLPPRAAPAGDTLEDTLDSLAGAVVTVDAEWRVTCLNHAAEELLGCSRDEAVGRELWRMVPAEFVQALERGFRQGAARTALPFEAFHADRGRWLQARLHAGPSGLAIHLEDITESRAAAERERTVAARLANTLHSVSDAFATLNREWQVTFVNRAAERIWGQPAEELVGRNFFTLLAQLPEAPLAAVVRQAMEERVARETECFQPLRDAWLKVRAFPMDEGIALSMTDVTEARRAQHEVLRLNAELERRVQERTAQLEQAYKDLEAFSYMLAHDLRGPIAAIATFSEFIEGSDEQALGPRSRDLLGRIRRAARRMEDMACAMLDLARLSYAPLECREVDLSALAEDALHALAEAQPRTGVRTRVEPGLVAYGDRGLLALLLQNLLSNAWKYTGRQDAALIEFGAEQRPEGRCFYVRDNGAGFDSNAAAGLFRPFTRLHGSEFPGSGVGLATVEKVVARHGGRIWAEARPGAGATFRLTLPKRPGPVEPSGGPP